MRVVVAQQRRGQGRALHEGRPPEVGREAVVCRAAEHHGHRGHEPPLAAQGVDPVQGCAQHPAPVVTPPEGREQPEQPRPRLERVGVVEPRASEHRGAEERDGEEGRDEQAEEAERGVLLGDELDPGERAEAQRRGPQPPAVGKQGQVGRDPCDPQHAGVEQAQRVDDPPDRPEHHRGEREPDPEPDVDDVRHGVPRGVRSEDEREQGPQRQGDGEDLRDERAASGSRAPLRASPAAARPSLSCSRGSRQRKAMATKEMSSAAPAATTSAVKGSGRSPRLPTP